MPVSLPIPAHPRLRPEHLLLRVLVALMLLIVVLLALKAPNAEHQYLPLDPNQTLVQGLGVANGSNGSVSKLERQKAETVSATDGSSRDTAAMGDPLLQAVTRHFTGDLDAMRKRGYIRVLVSYNRTNFFLVGADGDNLGVEAKGFEHDFMEAYKRFLNQKRSRRDPGVQMVYVPVAFDRLLAALNQGEGDLVAAGMTVTPARVGKVSFSHAYLNNINEVLVTHGNIAGLDTLEDLAGRRVRVLRGSSYARHLRGLSQRFEQQGLEPIRVEAVEASLQTEDMLELVNAGALAITVADQHLARLWAGVLPDIRVRQDLIINQGGELAWAVRKDNPRLLKSLNQFVKGHRKGTLMGNMLFQRFYRDRRWITNPVSKVEQRKLSKLSRLFKKYARQYGFDWLSLAAQAFQESGLEHHSRSHHGAIGIMQIKQATADDPNVAIRNINQLEPNIHAGSKYLAFLRDRYFSGPEFSDEDKLYFALAAYNAGPGAVRKMRTRAARMGLNPNRWFGQVELAALRQVGRETVTYVRNILKYSTAYKLSFAAEQRRSRDRRQLVGG